MSTYVTATDARKRFFALIDAASKPGNPVTVTLEGIPKVVMMSQEEFEGWMETLEVMSDSQLVKDIRAAKKEKKAIPWEKVKRKLRR